MGHHALLDHLWSAAKYLGYLSVSQDYCIRYCTAEIFCYIKILPKPAIVALRKIFHGIYFHPCSKDHYRLCVIFNMGQKVCGIKKKKIGQ